MRLQSTTGTVSLKNASGKSVSVREGMKLYSGYTISTSAKSYAYVSLDSTKVVKLDASTKVEVRKSGSKLELLVSSGELFSTCVCRALHERDAEHTHLTMVTGVRGTSGVVSVTATGGSGVSIYDGTVQVKSLASGENLSVSAGERLTVEQSAASTSELTDRCPRLCSRGDSGGREPAGANIGGSGLDVGQMADTAEQKLAADEAEAEAAQAAGRRGRGGPDGGMIRLPGTEQALPSMPVIIPSFEPGP